MNRREAISSIGILLGGTVSAGTISALLSGCSTPDERNFQPEFLSASQLRLVERLADVIIPETDTPGASAAGVHRFIDNLLANYYPLKDARLWSSTLDAFTAAYDAEALSLDELTRALTREDTLAFSSEDQHEGSSSWFFKRLKELVVSGYYTSEIGMTQELRLKPMGTGHSDIDRGQVERSWSN